MGASLLALAKSIYYFFLIWPVDLGESVSFQSYMPGYMIKVKLHVNP